MDDMFLYYPEYGQKFILSQSHIHVLLLSEINVRNKCIIYSYLSSFQMVYEITYYRRNMTQHISLEMYVFRPQSSTERQGTLESVDNKINEE